MKRKLKKQEKTALYVVGSLVVLILLWMVWLNPMRADIGNLRKVIERKKTSLKTAQQLKLEYQSYESDIEQYLAIIKYRPKGFSLKQHIADLENRLPFPHTIQRPETIKRLGKDYIKTTIELTYNGKKLDEIIKFLYEIEDPINAIAISGFELKPSSNGKSFDLRRISLSVVTNVEE